MRLWVCLLALALLLSGCAGADQALERGLKIRQDLLNAQGCRFSVEVTADYGDSLHRFSMDCEGNASGDLHFQVTQPESIAGITGQITESGGTLTFDDTALYFDLLTEEQLSPVSAPWILLKTLRGGYLTAACVEEEYLRLTIDDSYDGDALQLDIRLQAEAPVQADILYDGKRILTLCVENFVLL